MSKEKCLEILDDVIDIVSEMKEILEGSTDPDAPQAFLEFHNSAQHQLGRALEEALHPLLSLDFHQYAVVLNGAELCEAITGDRRVLCWGTTGQPASPRPVRFESVHAAKKWVSENRAFAAGSVIQVVVG